MTYSEKDVVNFLVVAIRNANSQEMMYVLHGNHVAWCVARFIESGEMEADVKKRFYSQDDPDFYVKDIGTVMPSMLYALAILGVDPVEITENLTYEIWDIDKVAKEIQSRFMYKDASSIAA